LGILDEVIREKEEEIRKKFEESVRNKEEIRERE
jgi:hypothetical protein